MNRSKVWINIRDSFWFMPAIYSIVALIVVLMTNLADAWLVSGLKDDFLKQVMTSKDTAKKLYATLVTAILTMTTLSFSVIMVVLTTYASQFSPRVLQNFMKSSFTQHVLGIYCSGFIFALVLLYLIDYGKPIIGPLVMVIMAIITLGAFVYFIHHSARFLQVNNLIGMIKNEGLKLIRQVFEKQKSYREYTDWEESEIDQLKAEEGKVIQAKRSGYVQNIQWNELVNWAASNHYVIKLHVHPGSFVPLGLPVMTIWTEGNVKDGVRSFLIIGEERSDIQDLEFTIQKIVEIALRGISPSTNDPHTAINCINRIGVLLIRLGKSYQAAPYLADTEDNLRLVHDPKAFEDYLYKSFYQIRHYGRSDVSVIHAILEVLYKIAVVSNPDIKGKVWQFHYYIMDVVEWNNLSTLDQDHLQEVYDRLQSACKEEQ